MAKIREAILETVKRQKIGGAELEGFALCFEERAAYLHRQYMERKCTDEEGNLVKKLECWLEDEGMPLFLNVLRQLSADADEKVKSFASLYRFFLENSDGDIEKLTDHMFYIPGCFAAEFMEEQTQLVGSIAGAVDGSLQKGEEEYRFHGSLDKGSLFLFDAFYHFKRAREIKRRRIG